MHPPIFIIGAGRSGTNILRDTLCYFPELITWPCDEINLIFRHGNKHLTHDEFGTEQARPEVSAFVRSAFEKLLKTNPDARVVEKTCANSLRVPFLHAIFPEAKFIFIIRNGYDVAASAKIRWTAPIEPTYLLKKFRYVPLIDIPYFLLQFVKNRWVQFWSKEKRMAIWGPIYDGMRKDSATRILDEVCALQWKHSAEKAYYDLKKLEQKSVFFTTYEDFCCNPQEVTKQIGKWLHFEWTDAQIKDATIAVRPLRKPENGQSNIQGQRDSAVKDIIDPIMDNIYKEIKDRCID